MDGVFQVSKIELAFGCPNPPAQSVTPGSSSTHALLQLIDSNSKIGWFAEA